ncbi:hypothetical protein RF11_05959 [Thelohanellus kitauei]|uniref:Uncharacterized protein n=1 Tax=Thelohanellus kitauei TaxID=669202 RepID=A0A0C2J754_THEKT|nr:hypothetical protein RF11_05959 [Thelohanellus kitauei]
MNIIMAFKNRRPPFNNWTDTRVYYLDHVGVFCKKTIDISHGKNENISIKLIITLTVGNNSRLMTGYRLMFDGPLEDDTYEITDTYGHFSLFVNFKSGHSEVVPMTNVTGNVIYPMYYLSHHDNVCIYGVVLYYI